MLHSSTLGLLLLVSSSFSAASTLFASARGRKAWQGALIGFLSWPLAFVLVDMFAEAHPDSSFYKATRSRTVRLGFFHAVSLLLLAPALGGLFFDLLVSDFYSGEMPLQHGGRLYAASDPILFYTSLFFVMCLAAFFSAAGLAAIVYTVLGRK